MTIIKESAPTSFTKKGTLKQVQGNVLAPQSGGLAFVISPVALSGKPEHPVMSLFDKRWASVKKEYKGWYSERVGFKMGELKTTAVQSDAWVLQCIYQDASNKFDEKGLTSCIEKLIKLAKYEKASIHLDKRVLEETPEWKDHLKTFVDSGVSVYLYEE